MPAEKPTTKSSENRRSNKPIMEKRRRARINSCLNDLKALILEALKKDPARHSKLEKADILEMTVKHLQNLQRQQMALATATDPNVANKFRAGFNECANEVTRFLGRMDGLDPAIQQRLLGHLANCLTGISAIPTFGYGSVTMASAPMSMLPAAIQPLSIHVPPNGLNSNVGHMLPMPHSNTNVGSKMEDTGMVAPPRNRVVNGLHLVPTRLPNGDFALLLPANYSLANNNAEAAGVTSNINMAATNATPTTITVPNAMLSPLTVSMSPVSSVAPTPSPASSVRLSPLSISPTQHSRNHFEKTPAPSHSLHVRTVKPELLVKERCREHTTILTARSPKSYPFAHKMALPDVRSKAFYRETTNKEPWRPW